MVSLHLTEIRARWLTGGSLHSASRYPTSTGAVHKSVTCSCVFILVQLNKCVVLICRGVFHHVVDVSALNICIVLRAFVVVISMCLLYVSLGSRVSPSILGLMFMGSVMLSICSSSCVLYHAGSGVKRVHVVFSGLRMRLFV